MEVYESDENVMKDLIEKDGRMREKIIKWKKFEEMEENIRKKSKIIFIIKEGEKVDKEKKRIKELIEKGDIMIDEGN